MKRISFISIIMTLSFFSFVILALAPSPSLNKEEIKNGWILLFDGKTFNGWKQIRNGGWRIHDGILSAESFNDGKSRDIITDNQYGNFELSLQFKIYKMTNSGIKYLVTNDYPGYEKEYLGLEYQILDEKNFIYPARGELRTTGSLYDLIPANKKGIVPLNKWNIARIIVKGKHVEHWLNGYKVVEYERGSSEFRSLVAKSKYKNYICFGENDSGYILLQNEGSPVDFRDIKIRLLDR